VAAKSVLAKSGYVHNGLEINHFGLGLGS